MADLDIIGNVNSLDEVNALEYGTSGYLLWVEQTDQTSTSPSTSLLLTGYYSCYAAALRLLFFQIVMIYYLGTQIVKHDGSLERDRPTLLLLSALYVHVASCNP